MLSSRHSAALVLLATFGSIGLVACGSSSSSGGGGGGSGGGAASCVTQMYGKYKAAAFTKVTDDLVATAAVDPQVGHYFSGLKTKAEVEAFEASLDQFLVMVYGGPNNYTGPDMPTAHKGLKISSDDYDYFVGLIVKTLEKDGVSKDDVTNCFAPPVTDAAFKASIVGK